MASFFNQRVLSGLVRPHPHSLLRGHPHIYIGNSSLFRAGFASRSPLYTRSFTCIAFLRSKHETVEKSVASSPITPISPYSQSYLAKKVTKEELLLQADGFVERFKIRSKWFLIRNPTRPLNIDEYSAVFSWVLMGHVLWFVLGTTTFVSLLIYGFNVLVNNEEYTSMLSSAILAHGLHLKVTLQGKALPEWKNGMLSFNDLMVESLPETDPKMEFGIKIEKINLSLSFAKWSEGRGLIDAVEVFGLRGVVKTEKMPASGNSDEAYWLPKSYALNSVKINDSYVEIHHKDHQNEAEPMKISIYNCNLPQLRSEWMLLDFFNADNVSGVINGSMFTIHKRQSSTKATAFVNDVEEDNSPWKKITRLRIDSVDLSKFARFNWVKKGEAELICDIMLPNDDLLLGEHMSATELQAGITNHLYGFVENLKDLFHDEKHHSYEYDSNGNDALLTGGLPAPQQRQSAVPYVVIDVKFQFQDGLKVCLPSTLPENPHTHEPFVSHQDLRRIINYINHAQSTLNSSEAEYPAGEQESYFSALSPVVSNAANIPVSAFQDHPANSSLAFTFRVIARHDHLRNQTTIRDTGLVDLIVQEAYNEVVKSVDESNIDILQFKIESEKNYNYWNHSVFGSLLLVGLGWLN
ncbi:hypothetical protein BABINDRAFT_109207 [Babjeviella inositovora NRRL Y-12698]|uniref:Mitochondrial distribution and morphology protein 31 n=1 Tax=Babjeviella inositovora NRRL Y-12698 TaxID=984486 RepID=A0A1E3QWZ7_9ASCO|nr:uncharacterized protein BABINDRAFT_109207 [Babjeviella inositovora NRRL Y-12698]ODQ81602.1 hypothetical protein BABINDRAFT_109207 [Babjeviella inositovora NRRL Y-12698]